MKTLTKVWAAIAIMVFMLTGYASMPIKPDSMTRGDYSYVKEYISWLARKEMKNNDVTGLSIALVDDQRVVWAGRFRFCRSGQQAAFHAGDDLPVRLDFQALHRHRSHAAGRAGQAGHRCRSRPICRNSPSRVASRMQVQSHPAPS